MVAVIAGLGAEFGYFRNGLSRDFREATGVQFQSLRENRLVKLPPPIASLAASNGEGFITPREEPLDVGHILDPRCG